ncbi:MAG: hypothetical protein IJI46_08760 [Erysipelotrichaceae bacterium]|nr:hypothetical protein [Erysipelotrichaceae bacterium]
MIKNDNRMFEGDDWLAKEIARESRISAWDLDEGKKLRQEHEENCDVREVADEHHQRHLRRSAYSQTKPAGKLSVWFYIDLCAIFIMFMINIILPKASFLPAAILFLALNPGIFVWLLVLKRMPSEAYLKGAFVLAVFLEIYELVVGNYSYFRFLLWRYL